MYIIINRLAANKVPEGKFRHMRRSESLFIDDDDTHCSLKLTDIDKIPIICP